MITTNRKVPRSIIFFGPDGSGKTTQAEMLVTELRKNGIKTRKLWLRSLHTLAFIISRIAMSMLNLRNVYEFREKYSHRKSFRVLWYAIEFVSILPLVVFRFRIPLMRGYTIVAERYVIDWIVSLSYVSRNESLLYSRLAKMALTLIPKDSVLIYIDASYDAILSRGRNEDSFEFIEFQRRSYAIIARMLSATVIDTSDKSLQEVQKLVRDQTLALYTQRQN
jgi:thymidylate kinase